MARDTSVQQGSHAHITTAPSTQHTWNTEEISSRYRGNNRHTIALPVEENIDTQGHDFPPYIFSMVEQATGEITWDYWGLLKLTFSGTCTLSVRVGVGEGVYTGGIAYRASLGTAAVAGGTRVEL